MIGWILKKILGTQNQREVRRMLPSVQEINRLEEGLRPLSRE
jgi:preprotein translocase subunit SecA